MLFDPLGKGRGVGLTMGQIESGFGLLDKFDVPGPGMEVEVDGEREWERGRKWGKFRKAIGRLNDQAPRNTVYKVLYLARHGQGAHVCSSFPFLLDTARDWRWADVIGRMLLVCAFLFAGYMTNS